MTRIGLVLAWVLCASSQAASLHPYAFGVLNQRNLQATAAYWNPILSYVSARSGVPLELHMARTANETTDRMVAGKLDFAYTNHLFTPKRERLGWRVLVRQASPGIRGQIVVLERSPVHALPALAGKPVAFANPYGFTGYYLPMDRLLRAGVKVVPQFSGNQEAAMGQLMSGQVAAAGVNDQLMDDFARRHHVKYRVLAQSEPYLDLAIMASPRVDASVREKIRQAFAQMTRDAEGMRVLRESARSLGLAEPRGFVGAQEQDYSNYRRFFKRTRVPLNE